MTTTNCQNEVTYPPKGKCLMPTCEKQGTYVGTYFGVDDPPPIDYFYCEDHQSKCMTCGCLAGSEVFCSDECDEGYMRKKKD